MEPVLEAKRSLLDSRKEIWTCQNLHGPIRCSEGVYGFYKSPKKVELCGSFFLTALYLKSEDHCGSI